MDQATPTSTRPGPDRETERYPLTPLLDAARCVADLPPWTPQRHWGFSLVDLARVLGVASRTLHRYGHDGIPWTQADRFAVRLGLHPCMVWADWWERCPVAVA